MHACMHACRDKTRAPQRVVVEEIMICIHTCTPTYTDTERILRSGACSGNAQDKVRSEPLSAAKRMICTHTCTNAYMHTYIRVYIYIHTCIYIHRIFGPCACSGSAQGQRQTRATQRRGAEETFRQEHLGHNHAAECIVHSGRDRGIDSHGVHAGEKKGSVSKHVSLCISLSLSLCTYVCMYAYMYAIMLVNVLYISGSNCGLDFDALHSPEKCVCALCCLCASVCLCTCL
jgi:hypothetical protein